MFKKILAYSYLILLALVYFIGFGYQAIKHDDIWAAILVLMPIGVLLIYLIPVAIYTIGKD